MKKFKFSALFSIVLISLLIMGAVSATDTDGVIGIDDVGADDDGILTIDNPDEVIIGDDNSGDNRVEKTLTNFENDIQAGNDVKLENDTQTSDIANVESDPILGIDAKPGTFTDLQAQIEEAAGGRLVLPYNFAYDPEYDGENFPEGIIIDSNMYIVGSGYTISGSDSNRIFKVTDNSFLQISDVTLTNGAADNGGAVFVDQGSSFTSLQTTFTNNVAVYRGGAVYSEGFVDIYYSVLDGNDVTYRAQNQLNGGAAIYVKNSFLTLLDTRIINNGKNFKYKTTEDEERDLLESVVALVDSSATVRNCLFKNNSACYGGALSIINQDDTLDELIVTNSNFTDNRAYNGAGIDINSATFNVKNSTFKGNEVRGTGSAGTLNSCGGAIAMGGDKTTGIINNCTFEENFAEYTGGAILIGSGISNDAQILINDSVFIKNRVLSTTNRGKNLGGAIRDEHYGTIVANSTFKENYANYEGGAIYYNNQYSLTDSCVFEDNEANYMGGAIYYNHYNNKINNSEFSKNIATTNNGGAIALVQARTLSIDNSKFTENEANSGGAIYNGALTITNTSFTSNVARSTYGGAINAYGASTITDSNFTSNSAKTTGGAIWLGNQAHTNIKNSKFDMNTAGSNGGALWANANVGMVYTNFTSNNATGNGGAIYTQKTLSIDNAVFDENSAKLGGAIYDNGNLILTDSTLTGNNATQGAAVYIVKAKQATISISEFTDNNCNENSHSIYNDGTLALSRNTISNAIYNNLGTITTQTYTVVLNNETKVVSDAPVTIDVVVLDDNNNKITGFNAFNMTVLIDSVGYKSNATLSDEYVYETEFTPETLGKYLVSANYSGIAGLTNNVLKTGELYYIKGTYTDLAAKIEDAIANHDGVLNLPYDFAYTEGIDGDNFPDGVVIDNNIYIVGNDFSISGDGSHRIFKVINNSILKTDDVTLRDGVADKGGAIYVDQGSSYNSQNVVFTDNTAVYRGGAIYSESTLNVDHCVFDRNDITFRTRNDDNGGAAIYNLNGTLTINNTNITNSVKDIVIRNGNAGDLLVGVVVTSGDTLINNSYFANNTGSWGGAISSLGYMNNNPYTLTVENTKFEGNNATFGGAIFVESSELVVDNCTFENNKGVGVGSSGTSNTQGGAIVVFPSGAKASITNSTFIANSANTGGAVSFAGVDQDSLIDNCTFTDNTASDGGAVYLWTGGDAVVTVKDSDFSGNTAEWGNAISNDGKLALSNNTISSTSADIGNYYGVIVSEINVVVLNNMTVDFIDEVLITAKVTDDNNNLIKDINFDFDINGTIVHAVFNSTSGLYQGTYTNDVLGVYVANMTYPVEENLIVKTATLRNIKGTYTDLQAQIDAAEDFGLLFLPYDFTYNEAIDGDNFPDGVIIDSNMYIIGNEFTISGNGSHRIFRVTNGSVFKIDDVTLRDGVADKGGAVYVDEDSFYNSQNAVFTNNTAVYRGGAIYSEGIVDIYDSVLDDNDVTYRSRNDDNGGAAVYNMNGTLVILNSNITNNLRNITVRDGNKGDLLVGVVVTSGYTYISDSYFANNTGSWGGAITSLGYLNSEDYTLNVVNTRFEGNNATFGGAIFVESSELVVDNCTFENNRGVGVGSSGTSNTQGGAIVVFPSGAKATITDSTFIANSANSGGAVSLAGVDQDSLIDNCTFTDNTASDGGAVYLWTAGDAVVTVKDSDFSGNAADWGNAISSDGNLALSNNTVSTTSADIANYNGVIISEINVVILNNETVPFNGEILVTAKVTDDNDNLIRDINFEFVINETVLPAVFNTTSNLYQATYTNDVAGIYVANMTYPVEENFIVKTATLRNIKGTYTDLQAQIDAAGETLVLPYDFAYTESIDGDRFPDGVIISKTISIDGNGFTICGNDSYRIFDVIAGTLTLNNVTVCHGNASQGAGVYVCSGASLVADGVTFTDNTANTKGGAIYSEGDVTVKNSEIDSNDIATRKGPASADNGGAAIYNSKGTLYVENTNITNNLMNITIRNGNAGDLIDGAIVTSGETIIIDSYIANNTGSYGGAITSTGYANDQPYTLTVTGTTFEGNNATFGGAIFVESGVLVVDDCDFIENAGVGVGSSGTSNTQGGAIVVFPNDAKATITNSRFNKNGANLGGAVSLAGVDQDSLIDNCTFTDNTASSEGGAVYLWTQGDASVMIEDSEFSGNTAPWGNAISNDGILELSNNTVSTTSADIANYYGVITSEINAIILNNETVPFNGEILVTAKVTDDNDNLIRDINFEFVINETVLPAVFNTTSNLYQATYTNDVAGIYVANITYIDDENLKVKTATLRNIKGTYTDLAGKITDAILYHDGVLNLTYDFAYTPEIDEVYIEGIIIQGTSLLTVNGNNHTISGSKLAGIFNIQLENTVTFNNVTFANAYAGAILTTSKLIINNCAFINNTDYYDGGYDEGGAISSFTGELVITDSVFINNTARDGGAIDVEGANVTLTNCVFTGNKAVGDGIDSGTGGAISTGNDEQTLTVNNCVFANNIASTSAVSPEYAPKGGAISSSGHVIINNSNFTNNSADYGGAIEFAFASAEISNSNFTDNTAVYRGGAIYSESTLNVDHCVFDRNDITFRTRNDDNGGAAIYNLNGTLTINNTNITNSVKDIVIRNGNAGDLLVGVVVTSGDTLINNSYFANNTGSWGGAISSLGYMNNNPYTLTVENTKFEGNNATFGGAIFVESSELVVDNCTFENNKGVGVGSSGTSNTQGGAIVVFPSGAKASITNSTFIANSANTGGAVSFAGVDQDSLIDNCTFTDNTASDGGAVYLWTGGDAVVTVKDSDFSGNTAEWGNAISNDGKLALSNNTISSTSADIGNYYGVIVSEINVVVLNNMTVDFIDEVLITAKVTDDNNNLIKDINFDFDINGTIVHAVFNSTSGLYQGTYTNDVLGVYVANMTYPVEENLIVKTATLRNIKGTFTDLAGKILDAILYHDGVLNLTYDFAYVEDIDLPYNYGIVIGGDSLFTINGNNHTISGSNLSGIFNIQVENALTFNNITFANAYAGAILNLDSKLIINNCTFINNTNYYDGAYDEGGAISSTGGELVIADSVFINNTAADGGAIEIEGANVTLTNCVFTNNTAAGDGVDSGTGGAIRAGNDDETLIVNNCVFTNNIASTSGSSPEYAPHGGAILSSGHVIITNSNFTNNSADEGGAIMFASASAEISNSNFADNTASECAADIYNRQSITNIRDCTFDANNADEVSAIYNDDGSELSLSNNNISSTKAEIVSEGTITSTINAVVLDNTTVPAQRGNKLKLTAKVTDDNGNLINDDKFQIVVEGVALSTVYNAETALYEANYTVEIGGQKIVNMTYATTDNLVTYIGILDVPKENATLIVTADDILQGENATVTVELYGLNNVKLNETFTVIVNNTEYNVTTVNGTATFNVTDLPAGLYSAVAIFSNQNYNKVINSTIFAVKAETVLTINVENIAYGEDAIIEATLTDKDGNNVTDVVVAVTIDGKTYNIAIENGKGSAIVTGLAVGNNYNASAVFEGDINYGTSNASDLFNVSKAAASISADVPSEALEGDNVTVTVTVDPTDATGEIKVYVDGKEYGTFNIGDEIIIKDLTNGTHTIGVQYAGDNNYDASNILNSTIKVKVNLTESDLRSLGSIGPYGTNSSVIMEIFYEDATGNVTVIVDGVPYTGVLDDGEVLIMLPVLDVGDYDDLPFIYSGDDKYTGVNTYVGVFVLPIDTEVVVTPSENNKVGDVANVTVTVVPKFGDSDVTVYIDKDNNTIEKANDAASVAPEYPTGSVTIVIDGIAYDPLDLVNGTITMPVAGLAAGNHTVSAYYEGDDIFTGSVGNNTLEVTKAEPNMNVSVEVGTVLDDVNVTVNVPEDATGYVLIKVDDKPATFAEIENGVAKAAISDLSPGPHNVTVTYLGDDNYSNETCSTSLNMEKAPTNTTINVTVDGFDVEITVNVNSTEVVDGGSVTLTFNDKNTTATVVDGVAVFKFKNLDAKTYSIVASYEGNNKFLPSNATGSVKLVRIASYIKPVYKPFIFNYGQLYKFRLVDKEGNGIAGKTIEFSVHSKVYYVKTGKDGWGQIQLTTEMLIHADKIFSRLIFRGDTQYKPSTYAVWFNAMKEPSKFVDVKPIKASYKVSESKKQITATLKDSKDKGIGGKQVSINIGGKTITAKTNSNGVVIFNVGSVKLNVGSNAFTLLFEDVNYKKASYWGTINIVKD